MVRTKKYRRWRLSASVCSGFPTRSPFSQGFFRIDRRSAERQGFFSSGSILYAFKKLMLLIVNIALLFTHQARTRHPAPAAADGRSSQCETVRMCTIFFKAIVREHESWHFRNQPQPAESIRTFIGEMQDFGRILSESDFGTEVDRHNEHRDEFGTSGMPYTQANSPEPGFIGGHPGDMDETARNSIYLRNERRRIVVPDRKSSPR